MIVTFLYRIGEVTRYGKYIGYISDKYEEGLDIEIQTILYPYIKTYYHLTNPQEFMVGIMSYQRASYQYFSPEERNVFQLIFCNFNNENKELYIHGVQQRIADSVV